MDDAEVFPPCVGTDTECGQASEWNDWGKAEISRADSLIELSSSFHLQRVIAMRLLKITIIN